MKSSTFYLFLLLTGRLVAGITVRLEKRSNFTSNLIWTPCGDHFECGNISVPLDWSNSSDSRTSAIAINRYLATSSSKLGS